jgi:hypothetical protein
MFLKRLLQLGLLCFSVMVVGVAPVLMHAQDEHEMTVELTDDMRAMIHDVRDSTAGFRDLESAETAGYAKFLDCFTNQDGLGMGQHFVNGELVGDDVLDPLTPEALVYEPQADGTLALVALEYLVFEDQWTSDEPPTLFGLEFHLRTNIPETPPVWALHIWLWTHNPDGLFADYNPIVFCPEDYPLTIPA